MPFILLALFILVPLVEIALFITVGQQIGLLWTILIVIVTAVIGTAMVQQQGLSALQRGQAEMQKGQLPVGPMRDGFFLFGAGALLLTPGFLTDAVGFALLIPPVRKRISDFIMKRVMNSPHIKVQSTIFETTDRPGPHEEPPRQPPPGKGPVIDGEFSEIRPDATSSSDARTEKETRTKTSDPSPWRR